MPLNIADQSRPIVVKIGGSTLDAHDSTIRDIAEAYLDGHRIVVVHGGTKAIGQALQRHQIEPRFIRGRRVTDRDTLEIVVAVLCGQVNKQLVGEFCALGVHAIGLSGADDSILQAESEDPALELVGRVTRVNAAPIEELLRSGYLPVVAPIGISISGNQHQLWNINADTAAGALAAGLNAGSLMLLTDVDGVKNSEGQLIHKLTSRDAAQLIASGVATMGMIPKLEAAVEASNQPAPCRTHIVNGTKPDVLPRLLNGEELGTTVLSSELVAV